MIPPRFREVDIVLHMQEDHDGYLVPILAEADEQKPWSSKSSSRRNDVPDSTSRQSQQAINNYPTQQLSRGKENGLQSRKLSNHFEILFILVLIWMVRKALPGTCNIVCSSTGMTWYMCSEVRPVCICWSAYVSILLHLFFSLRFKMNASAHYSRSKETCHQNLSQWPFHIRFAWLWRIRKPPRADFLV